MRRRLVAGVSIALALALPASSALAHQGNVNFRSELDGIEPPVPGLDVQVLNYDDSLQLQNETGKTVVVDGYEASPTSASRPTARSRSTPARPPTT